MYRELLLIALCGFSSLSSAIEQPSVSLVGAWQVYKDDDTPGKKPVYEVMSFWSDGVFCIDRQPPQTPYKGNYMLKQSSLFLRVELADRTINMDRQFRLQGRELSFKNRKMGWVYYRQINKKPQQICLDRFN